MLLPLFHSSAIRKGADFQSVRSARSGYPLLSCASRNGLQLLAQHVDGVGTVRVA